MSLVLLARGALPFSQQDCECEDSHLVVATACQTRVLVFNPPKTPARRRPRSCFTGEVPCSERWRAVPSSPRRWAQIQALNFGTDSTVSPLHHTSSVQPAGSKPDKRNKLHSTPVAVNLFRLRGPLERLLQCGLFPQGALCACLHAH